MPQSASALIHSAFYRFVPLEDPVASADALRAAAHGLLGSIVVAREGVNGAVAGTPQAIAAFEAALRAGALGPQLPDLVFKHSACITAPFRRFKVSVKPEIVALGLPKMQDAGLADERDASHLSPQAWRELLARGDAVVLDNRNHFEFRLGHFRGAVDPRVHRFSDFVDYVEAHAPQWRAQGRPVAMYCTGGIRCDKTAPWLRSLGLAVWQLDGGVLNYFAQLPSAADWQGECFVFDRRVALDAQLRETATTAEQVFDPAHPEEAWRLERALRLDVDMDAQVAAPASDGATR